MFLSSGWVLPALLIAATLQVPSSPSVLSGRLIRAPQPPIHAPANASPVVVPQGESGEEEPRTISIDAAVRRRIAKGEAWVPVIVLLEGTGGGGWPPYITHRHERSRAIRLAQDGVVQHLGQTFRLRHRYRTAPGLAGTIGASGLERIASAPAVRRLYLDQEVELHLNEGKALIRADWAQGQGFSGQGQTVAVIDTGVDYTHPDFSATTVHSGWDFGDGDPDAMDDCVGGHAGHGTAVAGIIAGGNGVAPGANMVALKVARSADCDLFMSDVDAALDWCVTNRATYGITVINLSLGQGAFSGACDADDPVAATIVNNAVDFGITIFAASGNDGFWNQIGLPACLSNVVSVGAVYDADLGPKQWEVCSDAVTSADQVTCYSNSAPFLDLLAPGHSTSTTGNASFGGTSAASPYAAGAAALIGEWNPALVPDQIRRLLRETGDLLYDPGSGVWTPRVNLQRAMSSRSLPSDALADTRLLLRSPSKQVDGSLFLAWYPIPEATAYDVYMGSITSPWSYSHDFLLACEVPSLKYWLGGVSGRDGPDRYYLVLPRTARGRTAGRDSDGVERPLPPPCVSPPCNRPDCSAEVFYDSLEILPSGTIRLPFDGGLMFPLVDVDVLEGGSVDGSYVTAEVAILEQNGRYKHFLVLHNADPAPVLARIRAMAYRPDQLGPLLREESFQLDAQDVVYYTVTADAVASFIVHVATESAPGSPNAGIWMTNHFYWDDTRHWRTIGVTNTDIVPVQVNLQVRDAGNLRGFPIQSDSAQFPAEGGAAFFGGPFDDGEPFTWFDILPATPSDPGTPLTFWTPLTVNDSGNWYDTVYIENPNTSPMTIDFGTWYFGECCD